jgi:hypothetical protein
MLKKDQFNAIKKYVKKHNGATIELFYTYHMESCVNIGFVKLKSGYSVSIKDKQKVLTDLSMESLNAYIKDNYKILASGNNYYLGIWIDNGKIYLDISRIYESIYNTLDECNYNKQIAYYSFALAKSVKING